MVLRKDSTLRPVAVNGFPASDQYPVQSSHTFLSAHCQDLLFSAHACDAADPVFGAAGNTQASSKPVWDVLQKSSLMKSAKALISQISKLGAARRTKKGPKGRSKQKSHEPQNSASGNRAGAYPQLGQSITRSTVLHPSVVLWSHHVSFITHPCSQAL